MNENTFEKIFRFFFTNWPIRTTIFLCLVFVAQFFVIWIIVQLIKGVL